MNKTCSIIFVFICIMTFVQCKKHCYQEELPDKKFTEGELNILPYSGNEKLTFMNEFGDSVCYAGQGRNSQMYLDYEVMDPDEDDECFGDYRMVETVYLSFNSSNSDTTISFGLRFFHPFNTLENDKYFNLKFSHWAGYNSSSFYGTYSFETNNIFNPKYTSWQDNCFVNGYHDTLTLHGQTYDNVYELSRDVSNILPQYMYFQTVTIYYSIIKGIVGYKKASGAIWYLSKIV